MKIIIEDEEEVTIQHQPKRTKSVKELIKIFKSAEKPKKTYYVKKKDRLTKEENQLAEELDDEEDV